MNELSINTKEIEKMSESLTLISKSIQPQIDAMAKQFEELNKNLNPIVVNMNETIEKINLQIQPLRDSMQESMKAYNEAIKPLIESMENIKYSLENASIRINETINKLGIEKIVVTEDDIKESKDILTSIEEDDISYINENYTQQYIEDEIVSNFESAINNTKNKDSKMIVLKDIIESIKYEIIKKTQENTLLEKLIIPTISMGIQLIPILTALISGESSNVIYNINTPINIEYNIINNNCYKKENYINIFQGTEEDGINISKLNKDELSLVEVLKVEGEYSYIKANINGTEIKGWIISKELLNTEYI